MERMQRSALEVGGQGVVEVKVTEGPMSFARHAVGFTAWGTAVTPRGRGAPVRRARGRPPARRRRGHLRGGEPARAPDQEGRTPVSDATGTGTPGPARSSRMDGPDAFAALFAPGGRFCDPVTPWTTDVRKVARDTDAIFPDWAQRVDRIRGGEDWAVFEWTGTGTFTPAGKAGHPDHDAGGDGDRGRRRRQGHVVARLPRHQRADAADPGRARARPRGRLTDAADRLADR